jgi:hypothetical protein
MATNWSNFSVIGFFFQRSIHGLLGLVKNAGLSSLIAGAMLQRMQANEPAFVEFMRLFHERPLNMNPRIGPCGRESYYLWATSICPENSG